MEPLLQGRWGSSGAEALVAHHVRRVYKLTLRMLGGEADAAEVTQQVLSRAFPWRGAFPDQADLSAWLCRIAVETIRLRRGALAGARTAPPREGSEPIQEVAADGRLTAEPPDEDQPLLENAISRLPEPYRDVYVLADVEGWHHPDIGDALGLSSAAIKSRLSRARLFVRKRIASRAPEQSS